MAEITEQNTTLSEPFTLPESTFKEPNESGLEPTLTKCAIATITPDANAKTGDANTKTGDANTTPSIFLASDGNTAFALNTQEYAHLTYPRDAPVGPINDTSDVPMVVRSIDLAQMPLTPTMTWDHRWKGMMESWRSKVESMNADEAQSATSAPSNTTTSTIKGGQRWVPASKPSGPWPPETAADTKQHITWGVTRCIRPLSDSSATEEVHLSAAKKYFTIIQGIKPIWD